MSDPSNPSSRVIWANVSELNKNFMSNEVVTTKYNLITFLPFSLFIQFRRVSNIYFLITAVLQSIPQISPLQPFTAIAPLVFVLGISMIREGIEDYLRYKSDKEINNSPTSIYDNGNFKKICFKDIKVGDIVFVSKDEVFPCDIVMLSNSNENGTAYIETSSLDGEKALKPRQAFIHTSGSFGNNKINRILSVIECELPNSRLYNFSGTYEYRNTKYPLDKANLLLAGAFLRNTEWIIGISVYTGKDTKLRQNMMDRKYKQSHIDRRSNFYIIIVLIFQFFLCFSAAIASGVWVSKHITKVYTRQEDHTYIRYSDSYTIYNQGGSQGVLGYFTYFLLLNTMLPISLVVSMEILKLAQGFFMMLDLNMYSEKRDRTCNVSSFSLNEELGMIKHIFSDKTGTLTCNQMEFKFFCVGNRIYGDQSTLVDLGLKTVVTYEDREVKYTFLDKNLENDLFVNKKESLRYPIELDGDDENISTQKDICSMILKCMSLCHECIIEENLGQVKYIGPSPDDVVLVDAARRIGYKLVQIKSEVLTLNIKSSLDQSGKDLSYKRICILEFNSDRKRMSAIFKEQQTGKYIIFMKGADSVMLSRLSEGNNREYIKDINRRVDAFSRRGFRTLIMAFKYINPEEFQDWKMKYDEAANQINNREKAIGDVAEEIEKNMYLLGCTAVEDALQDDVPETINDLLKAGLSFWMLTGDKLETAENIGKTCTLIDDNMLVERCSESKVIKCFETIEKIHKSFTNCHDKIRALIIEGSSLQIILYDEKNSASRERFPDITSSQENINYAKNAQKLFLEIAEMCKTIICCRVSPGEKKDVVRLIKKSSNKVTLSIGDGANDVPMILEAHIGVGLYGEEGIQAVQASDYALGEFRYLWELLLIHGRFNYIRQSEMILYFFYKNLIFTIPQFLFASYCAYSGQTVYDDWYLTFYNLFFTALPLFVRGLFERDFDVPARWESVGENALEHKKALREKIPNVYSVGRENQIFTLSNFLLNVFNGVFHSCIVFFIPLYASEEGIFTSDGQSYDLWSFSIASFSCIIIIVNIKIGLATKLWNKFHYFSVLFISVVLYFVFILIYDVTTYTPAYHTVLFLIKTHYFYFCILSTVTLVCCIDFPLTVIFKTFFPTDSDKLVQENRRRVLSDKFAKKESTSDIEVKKSKIDKMSLSQNQFDQNELTNYNPRHSPTLKDNQI
jgi:phospholipid-transporting ATPase